MHYNLYEVTSILSQVTLGLNPSSFTIVPSNKLISILWIKTSSDFNQSQSLVKEKDLLIVSSYKQVYKVSIQV